MQKYAYATNCRRGFVLRYFGDAAARARCDSCDNCLGTHMTVEAGPRRPKRTTRTVADRRPRGSRAGIADDVELGAGDAALLSELRALRGRIAREEKVPAYVVFPDRALAEMALKRPASLTALTDVYGVGPARRDKYGERFLTVIRGADGTEAA
jgi:ATP-dependent DNA helicase RecQ